MGTDHPPRDKQAHFAKPSLWVAEPTDGISEISGVRRQGLSVSMSGSHTMPSFEAATSRGLQYIAFGSAENFPQTPRERAADRRLAGEEVRNPTLERLDRTEGMSAHRIQIEQAAELVFPE